MRRVISVVALLAAGHQVRVRVVRRIVVQVHRCQDDLGFGDWMGFAMASLAAFAFVFAALADTLATACRALELDPLADRLPVETLAWPEWGFPEAPDSDGC